MKIAEIVLPVLLALFLGWLCRRKGILSPAQVDGLKTFVVTFSLPAVLFGAFYATSYSISVLATAAAVYAACTAALFAGRLLARRVRSLPKLTPFLVSGFEAGMMGYALYTLLFGAQRLTTMAVAALGEDVFVFTLYMALLKGQSGMKPRQIAKETLTSPIFLAIAAGVLCGATGLAAALSRTGAGRVIEATVNFFSAPTACAILFVVGYSIRFTGADLKQALRLAALRLGMVGALGAAVILLLRAAIDMDRYMLFALLLLFSLPGPYVLPVFLRDPDDERTASTALSLYTLLSIALFCLLAVLAM